MTRGLRHSLSALSVVALLAAHVGATGPAGASPLILQRFLALDDPTPTQFRALRHLEARNDKFEKSAWMDVWTEADAAGFRYHVISEDGSDYIRSKVFRASLDAESTMWSPGSADAGALTPANYEFEDRGPQPDGLASIAVTPRRKNMLLVDRSIHLHPDDGELIRLEGRLSNTQSFRTPRHGQISVSQLLPEFGSPRLAHSVPLVSL